MLVKLLKKELRLCLHPAAVILLLLAALLLVPGYPYGLMYFYLGLGLFFICLSARENHDVSFTLCLPVPKKSLVTARFLLALVLELAQLLLALALIWLRRKLYSPAYAANPAGMDANIALIGQGFLCYGLFHLVFFPLHYRDVSKVGGPFVAASVALGLLILADIVLSYTVPLFRDVLDSPDPAHTGAKLLFCLLCLVFDSLATLLALRLSQRRFEKLDIR